MQIKVNMEIRKVKDEVAWGLTPRQLSWSALCAAGTVAIYIAVTFSNMANGELAWIISLIWGAPCAAVGFVEWHHMPLEKVVLCWVYTLFSKKQVVFKGTNVHSEAIKALLHHKEETGKGKKHGNKKDIKQVE